MEPKTTHQTMDLEAAFEFVKRYHPDLWDRMKEQDILDVLSIGQVLFKVRPELLEATTNTRFPPTQ